MENETPTLDVPKNGANIEELAENMTDKELRALIILIHRQVQELVAGKRELEQLIASFGANGGMLGRAMGRSGNPAKRAQAMTMQEMAKAAGLALPPMPGA